MNFGYKWRVNEYVQVLKHFWSFSYATRLDVKFTVQYSRKLILQNQNEDIVKLAVY